jgi:hypothetical protein
MTETNYLVPTGDGKSQIAIDLLEIAKAELRLQDVAIVNQHTAPELLSSFNDAWLKLNKNVATLTFQKNVADNANTIARATAKLSCTDEAIKARGHFKASADLREAFVELDEAVKATKERMDEIGFVLDVLRGKMQAFFNAYTSVKRLTDGKSLPPPTYGAGNQLTPTIPFSQPPSKTPTPSQDPDFEPLPAGFGTLRK